MKNKPKIFTREWVIYVRFWAVLFILASGWFTWVCFKWVTGLEVRGDYDIALPVLAFGLTADLVKKFNDTRGDPVADRGENESD